MALQAHNDQSANLPEAPAPWSTRCETYWLVLNLPSPLPLDIYDPLEATHPAMSARCFSGGIGMVMIVRYSDTPVGSYDELVIIPGKFLVPGGELKGKDRMRISRIYVSQRETTYNGRRNWNIPKHLARFEFSAPPIKKGESPPSSLTVSVYPHEKSATSHLPFFRATLTPASWTPAFPLSTTWLPLNMTFVQPPIPAGDDAILVGTDVWRSYEVVSRTSRARLMWVKNDQSQGVAADGFWPIVKPWSFGVFLEDATMDISTPSEWQE
ncbi:hypothetical protein LTR53_004362 [Teratosphaeriaceae sp. CCFEE 6253]|nr:hypothetical protein LTR53_004362 [Teratosphaeriaceae sp. CCFEE 6253]